MRDAKEKKYYYNELKNDILDESNKIFNKYKKFPWDKIYKIKNNVLNHQTPVRVNGVLFSVKELIKRIKFIEKRTKIKSKPSGYKHILKAYIYGIRGVQNTEVRNVYITYKKAPIPRK